MHTPVRVCAVDSLFLSTLDDEEPYQSIVIWYNDSKGLKSKYTNPLQLSLKIAVLLVLEPMGARTARS